MVNVYPVLDVQRAEPEGDVFMSGAIENEMRKREAGSKVLKDGQYFEWSKGDKGTSLLWSSDKTLPELITAADSVLGAADSHHRGLVDFDDKPSLPVTAARARELALSKPQAVTFLRIEYQSGLALVWTPSPGTEELSQLSTFSEASVFFSPDQSGVVTRAIGAMATNSVVQMADKIVKSVAG
ncbi:hypothetical protein [Microbacterium sp. T32]|uniref:hypothetical protein n=1 Tax=Microbacterium sp. T32 TaxID=1776083 RepID=UPI001E3DB13D|nr:hypothetical protein [Microbacterium sp. T32]